MNVCRKDQPAAAQTSFKCAPFDKACEAATLRVEWVWHQWNNMGCLINKFASENQCDIGMFRGSGTLVAHPKADKVLIGLMQLAWVMNGRPGLDNKMFYCGCILLDIVLLQHYLTATKTALRSSSLTRAFFYTVSFCQHRLIRRMCHYLYFAKHQKNVLMYIQYNLLQFSTENNSSGRKKPKTTLIPFLINYDYRGRSLNAA